MTTPAPDARRPVSSTPLLVTTLRWGGVMALVLAILGGLIGFLVDGTTGLWSALLGVLIAAVFLGITAASILIANRWFGDALYVPIFFGIVLGGWMVKFLVFLVVLFVLRGQPWLNDVIFFVAVVVSIIGSLVIDVVAMLRMRMPYVSDVSLPGDDDADPSDRARADS